MKTTKLLSCVVLALSIFLLNGCRSSSGDHARHADQAPAQLGSTQAQLDSMKANLARQGRYDCCLRRKCDWCLLRMGHCNCDELVQRGKQAKACPECAAEWNAKRKKVIDQDAGAVQLTTCGLYGFEKDGHHYGEGHRH